MQLTSNPVLIHNVVVRLFGDAGGVTKSVLDIKVMLVIQTVGNRSVPKTFQGTAIHFLQYWSRLYRDEH